MGNDSGSKENWFKRRGLFVMFVLGVAVGVTAAIVGPRVVEPYVPAAIGGDNELLRGIVRTKEFERDRLLLTIPTGKGTILATFTENAPEINMLVLEGDSVTLALSEYTPFAENPSIVGVVTLRAPNEEGVSDRPAEPGEEAGEKDTGGSNPARQDQT